MSKQDNSINKNPNNDKSTFSTEDYAVALGYNAKEADAPKVLAKGQGHIAEKIIQIALDEGIEIRHDEDLLQILKAVDIDSEIPVEAFAAVAEIISYIYKKNDNATLSAESK